jgi:gluconate 5-dehydrogenase
LIYNRLCYGGIFSFGYQNLGDPAFKAGIVNRVPLGRVGETADLVGAVLFFASPASSFVTGQILGIDGGLTATQ